MAAEDLRSELTTGHRIGAVAAAATGCLLVAGASAVLTGHPLPITPGARYRDHRRAPSRRDPERVQRLSCPLGDVDACRCASIEQSSAALAAGAAGGMRELAIRRRAGSRLRELAALRGPGAADRRAGACAGRRGGVRAGGRRVGPPTGTALKASVCSGTGVTQLAGMVICVPPVFVGLPLSTAARVLCGCDRWFKPPGAVGPALPRLPPRSESTAFARQIAPSFR